MKNFRPLSGPRSVTLQGGLGPKPQVETFCPRLRRKKNNRKENQIVNFFVVRIEMKKILNINQIFQNIVWAL